MNVIHYLSRHEQRLGVLSGDLAVEPGHVCIAYIRSMGGMGVMRVMRVMR